MGNKQDWYSHPLAGCVSSKGKPYSISLKQGSENKLLVNFLGGGASWNGETAQKPITIQSLLRKKEGFYISHVSPMMLKLGHVGLLSAKDQRNPFRNWHILNIPYTTADFHIGARDFHYKDARGKDKTLHHHGAKNVAAALGELKRFFAQTPDTLLIAGASAGAFGALAHAPTIQNLYPDCENTIVYAEGAHIHAPLWPEVVRDVWKASSDLCAHVKSADFIGDLFRYAEANMPANTRFLHAVSVWDEALTQFMSKMNHGKTEITEQTLQEFHNTLIDTVRNLKAEHNNYAYYLTDYGKKKDGTTPHIFSGSPKLLYGEMQDGVALADWIIGALEELPSDVGGKFVE
ncbi:MAG: pectin acetylesterase-family hydrolase [Oscillospiraceae bacterium]|nr:pectin acetylesterase-family hydrolase [Oscillospiraceae bacterium]